VKHLRMLNSKPMLSLSKGLPDEACAPWADICRYVNQAVCLVVDNCWYDYESSCWASDGCICDGKIYSG